MAGVEAIVKDSCMPRDIEQDCVDCAAFALSQLKEQVSIAQLLKRELDRKYGPSWHVIVGRQFGSFVAHESKDFLYFFIGDLAFLIWKTYPTDKDVPIKIQGDQFFH